MLKYTVGQGDCISSLAKRFGFPAKTLWDHPSNQTLKQARKNPNILKPGDVVCIPDKTLKEESRPTDQHHCFRKTSETAQLQLRLLDEGKPRAGESYTLYIDGIDVQGQSDSEGWIRQPIQPDAKEARLLLNGGAEQHVLKLGHLDPVDSVSGVQARLRNLGYYGGPADDQMGQELVVALKAFQRNNKLKETGQIDASTQSALKSAYGS